MLSYCVVYLSPGGMHYRYRCYAPNKKEAKRMCHDAMGVRYKDIVDGGKGIVKADSSEEAERKVRESYKKHGYEDTSEEVYIYEIWQKPFEDSPDVIEICEQ